MLHRPLLLIALLLIAAAPARADHTLADALAPLGDEPATLRIDRPLRVTDDATLPAHLHLRFEPPGQLVLEPGTTVRLHASLHAPPQQIFDTSADDARLIIEPDLIDEIHPQWWGARPDDDDHDDTPAIQAALDALAANSRNGHGTVRFLPGTYRLTDRLTLDADAVHLLGTGRAQVALDRADAPGPLLHLAGNHPRLEHLTLRASHGAGPDAAVVSVAPGTVHPLFQHTDFQTHGPGTALLLQSSFPQLNNNGFFAGHPDAVGLLIRQPDTDHLVIEHRVAECVFHGPGAGLRLRSNKTGARPEGIIVTDNTFHNVGPQGQIVVEDVLHLQISNNIIDSNTRGPAVRIRGGAVGAESIAIANNWLAGGGPDHAALHLQADNARTGATNVRINANEFQYAPYAAIAAHASETLRHSALAVTANHFRTGQQRYLLLDSVDRALIANNVFHPGYDPDAQQQLAIPAIVTPAPNTHPDGGQYLIHANLFHDHPDARPDLNPTDNTYRIDANMPDNP